MKHNLSAALIKIVICQALVALATAGAAAKDQKAEGRARLQEAYGRLPLSFEANRGQFDKQVQFVGRTNSGDAFLSPNKASFSLRTHSAPPVHGKPVSPQARPAAAAEISEASFSMTLVGGNAAAEATGLERLQTKANYIRGNDPSQWHTNIPTFGRVRFANVYSGVDLVYYGNQRQLEYDFLVHPGANPGAIRLAFDGVDSIALNAEGDLLLKIEGKEVVQKHPRVYQMAGTTEQEVSAAYVKLSKNEVAFRVGAYDKNRMLIIDPVLVYSTYLGGSGDDSATAVALDSLGNVYVVGTTSSRDFSLSHAMQGTNRSSGGYSAFVSKLNAAGSGFVYSTYLGGTGSDYASGIAVDGAGNAYIVGTTSSVDFPTMHPFQAANGGGAFDAFVAKLSANGSTLIYSTYLGGSQEDDGNAIAVDMMGHAYIAGITASTNFPTAHPIQAANGGGSYDAFVAKLNAAGSGLVYSTYVGGSSDDDAFAIAIDIGGNAYVSGYSNSTNFPTVRAIQSQNAGGYDGFLAKIDSFGTSFVYSTLLGGSGDDSCLGMAVDASGNAYVTGYSASKNFPTVNAIQSTNAGDYDAIVVRVTAQGTLAYSTYLGGSGTDVGNSIAVDGSGNIYITGVTSSRDFRVVNAVQPVHGGGTDDAFVLKLSSGGTRIVYSTYLGGSGDEMGAGIAVDPSGNAYAVGFTSSTNFATRSAVQPAFGGGTYDAFLTKISNSPAITNVSPRSGGAAGGTLVTITGADFLSGVSATFGGVPAASLTLVNSNTLIVQTPAGAVGAVDITVSNFDGTRATLASAFTYVDDSSSSPSGSTSSPPSAPTGGAGQITPTENSAQVTAPVALGCSAAPVGSSNGWMLSLALMLGLALRRVARKV